MKTLIGITGLAGSGKDTFADALVHERRYQKISFATPIKEALNEIFGWSMREWNDREWKETPRTEAGGRSPRYLAQTLGTEWGRDLVSPDLWVSVAIERARRSPLPVVISDVRFPNEVDALREAGGVIIKIVRHGIERVAAHASEAHVDSIRPDIWVYNVRDIEELRRQAVALAGLIEKGLHTKTRPAVSGER